MLKSQQASHKTFRGGKESGSWKGDRRCGRSGVTVASPAGLVMFKIHHFRDTTVLYVAIYTDLSGKELHRHVDMGRMVTSGS